MVAVAGERRRPVAVVAVAGERRRPVAVVAGAAEEMDSFRP